MNLAEEYIRVFGLIEDAKAQLNMSHVKIALEFSDRMTTTMGRAWTYWDTKSGLIRLSTKLWKRAEESQRTEIAIHEAAHILANLIHKKNCGHGIHWRATMALLGYPNANRCHSVSTAGLRRRNRRYQIECPKCSITHKITANLRTRWLRGRQIRICNNCRGRLPHTLLS